MSNGTWEFFAIEFTDADPGHQLNNSFEIEGVAFTNQSKSPVKTVDALKSGVTGIQFGVGGLEIELGFGAQWVIAKGANKARPQLTLSAWNGASFVDSMAGPQVVGAAYLLEVGGDKITRLQLEGGGGEGILIWLKVGRRV